MRKYEWLAVAVALLAVTACRHREPHVVADAFHWSQPLPPGSRLYVRDLNGDVHVTRATGTVAQVSASKHWSRGRENDVHFVTNRIGNDVYVCALWGSGGRCDDRGYSTGHGSIWRIFSLRRHNTDMRVDFTVALPSGVAVDVLSMNGAADITGASTDVVAKLVNGSITAHTAGGALRLETVNGSITASVDSVNSDGPYRFATVNGSVSVAFPQTLQGSVILATVTGRVESDFPLGTSIRPDARTVRGSLGTANRTVSLQTVNGSVMLKKS